MLSDLGVAARVKLKTDASAAQGITNRRGLGQVRHIEVNQLWLQDRVNKGEMVVEKVPGKKNIADALTKYVTREDLGIHVEESGVEFRTGRHHLAPSIDESGNISTGVFAEYPDI